MRGRFALGTRCEWEPPHELCDLPARKRTGLRRRVLPDSPRFPLLSVASVTAEFVPAGHGASPPRGFVVTVDDWVEVEVEVEIEIEVEVEIEIVVTRGRSVAVRWVRTREPTDAEDECGIHRRVVYGGAKL